MHSKYSTIILAVAASLIFLGVPFTSAYAHSTGSSWEVSAGKYVADVGYDPIAFTAGEYTRFDFNLKVASGTSDQVDYAEVWVRIKNNQDTYLATGIRKQPIGPTTLLYLFSSPGDYSLEASYRTANGDEVGVASFPIVVAPSSDTPWLYGYTLDGVLLLFGLLLGSGGVWILTRYTKKPTV